MPVKIIPKIRLLGKMFYSLSNPWGKNLKPEI